MNVPSAWLESLPDAVLVVEGARVAWANRRAEALVGTRSSGLVGRPLIELIDQGEIDRILNLEQHRREGWNVPQILRVRLRRSGDRSVLFADVALARYEGLLLLTAREATESRAAEELMSQLGNLSTRGGAILDLEGLLAASSATFEALGWVVALIEVNGDIARLTRRAGVLRDNPVAEYTRALEGRDRPLAEYPVVSAVVKTGKALFLDDIPTAQSGPVHSAVALSERMAEARGLSRSAWLPVPDALGRVLVLAVAGNCLTEHDFVAIQLFAAQLASARRVTHLRSELVRRERLAAVGEMAAVLAHEVRNPLGVIFNAIGGLRRQTEAPESRALLEIVGEEAERLRRLVSDLLDFAKPPVPHAREVGLGPVVFDALASAQHDPGCEGKTYRVATHVPRDLPPVWADPELLRRALVNVVVNAIQNVVPGGEVRVSAQENEAGQLVLRVANDGPPINPEVAARIFEPFFTTRAMGTGLGLAVVKQIVEGLRGSVRLEPDAPGVSFALTLPTQSPLTSTG